MVKMFWVLGILLPVLGSGAHTAPQPVMNGTDLRMPTLIDFVLRLPHPVADAAGISVSRNRVVLRCGVYGRVGPTEIS